MFKYIYLGKIFFNITVLNLLLCTALYAQQHHATYTDYKLHLTYHKLSEPNSHLSKYCRFSSIKQEEAVMEKVCNYDEELRMKTSLLTDNCNFKDNKFKKEVIYNYCSFKTPLTRKKVLGSFCSYKTNSQKQHYIDNLVGITRVGPATQKTVNYRLFKELSAKRTESLDTSVYNPVSHPDTEAAYQLGVIYGFSQCGLRNKDNAIKYFQKAYKKPQNYFMLAELLRKQNKVENAKKIHDFYIQAANAGIKEAYYNLALYIYGTLNKRKITDNLPNNFTYNSVTKYLSKATELGDMAAQNDLPLLIKYMFKSKNNKAFNVTLKKYIPQAAAQNFSPALYNQIVLNINNDCTDQNLSLFKRNTQKLLQSNYKPIYDLLVLLQSNSCYANHAKNIIENLDHDINLIKHSKVDNFSLNKAALMIANSAFDEYNQSFEYNNVLH